MRLHEHQDLIQFILIILILSQILIIIPAFYYGFSREGNSCQKGTVGGLNLSKWLIYLGIEKAFLSVVFGGYLTYRALLSRCLFVLSSIIWIDFLFDVTWSILGVILLITSENKDCMSENNPLAITVVSEIVVILFWYTISYRKLSRLIELEN